MGLQVPSSLDSEISAKDLCGHLRNCLGEVFRELAFQKESSILEGHLLGNHVHGCNVRADRVEYSAIHLRNLHHAALDTMRCPPGSPESRDGGQVSGAPHHVTGRGIQRNKISLTTGDRNDFIARLCSDRRTRRTGSP